jgi:DNA-binding winged helix-turn-helix (wHTH) protein
MSQSTNHFYDFGPFRLDPAQRVLLQNGQRVALHPKAFETLRVLVENHGRIVEKGELMKRVWPDAFVEEGNLTVNIFLLRKVLSKGLSGTAPIETVPRRGYCFVAPVEVANGEPAKLGPATASSDAVVNIKRVGRSIPVAAARRRWLA